MIVATAGHIDHGKTALIKALTGVDTDCLPEEKARGISIDLGFAYCRLPNGRLLGFVDVPGHENFVRTMVAGAAGVDFALLVVAADDGIMPQTREHLKILDILGIARGAVAITKIDRVDPARVGTIIDNAAALIEPTSLRDAPIRRVSTVTGEGLADIKALLESETATYRRAEPSRRLFRFAVDRAFVVAGGGTVATGYVMGGLVRPRDRVSHFPSGAEVRVRRIRVHDSFVDCAEFGDRCAINLSGIPVAGLSRGDVLLDPCLNWPTTRIAVRASEPTAIPSALWTPIHVHIGTASTTGRVARLLAPSAGSEAETILKVDLDHPIIALHGDRVVLRDASARRTLAGGSIVDGERPRRSSRLYLAMLAGLRQSDPAGALSALAEAAPVALARIERLYGLAPGRARELCEGSALRIIGGTRTYALAARTYIELRDAVLVRLSMAQRASQADARLSHDATRQAIVPGWPPDVFADLCRDFAADGLVKTSGPWIVPAAGSNDIDPRERQWARIKRLLESGNFKPLDVRALAARLELQPEPLRTLLRRHAKAGDLLAVGERHFFPATTIRRLVDLLGQLTAASQDGLIAVGEFRDAIGTGRVLASDILEAFDGAGITKRNGPRRSLRDFGQQVPRPGDAHGSPPAGETAPNG